MRRHALLALLLVAGLSARPAAADEPANVTIYRCVDSRGQLVALRDSPCRAGERQETVQMQRPQDPPPRAASTVTPTPPPATAPVREVRVVTVQAPQPVYECTAPDGSTYTSDTGQGTARWVPLWTVGFPVWPSPPRPGPPPRPPVPPSPRPADGADTAGRWPPHPGPGPRPLPPGVVVPAGGTWVNDPCVRLLQQEVCQRLSDRRFEILRVYHAAMPSGRAELDREQRAIDARMATDCPGS
ncbi:DUF4124 domain-containing protein [Pseudoxanthomonas suwonensis]|uniref:DUF4124 domain-containing protein n=1 Tax=Pseudoxanthomonas suwonensis TaxID=314722 RepID=A0A0E3UMP3_9GAMM|nr:DUF4124 domain-containing protein [Pseudoxanthomonas suwonensis]AKC86506.1 hypothetical protein WQ53_06725 [Pseudoxanthomonas suwonensis]